MPKNTLLESDIVVKSMPAARTPSSLVHGKRIVICATNKRTVSDGTEHKGIFFSIYNTVFNLTEYVFEDYLADSEVFKDVQINQQTNFIALISASNDVVKIRGFALDSSVFN